MLTIEKQKDVKVLLSMGASKRLIRRIFLMEGFIIALTGTIVGLTLGFVVCYIQQKYGWVSMGMETAVVDAYPVEIHAFDYVFTGLIILVLTFIISYRPAYQASQISVK